jgi:leader peptidase (prepilin peptidase)/N-methyltransferase
MPGSVDVALAVFALAPGLALGSFLSVVAARLPDRRSLVPPRSVCRSCGRTNAWRDQLPLVGYALARGRCRACGWRIGLLSPALELATALLVAGCILAFGATLRAAAAGVFSCALVVVTATDIERRIVPNRVVLPGTVFVLGLQTASRPSAEWAIAAAAASGFLLLAALAYPAGMGLGDVKLALLMGAALGREVAVALMLAMIAALVPSLVLLARHGSRARKMAIPFAPFLALGSVVALFAGERLLDWYLATFRG